MGAITAPVPIARAIGKGAGTQVTACGAACRGTGGRTLAQQLSALARRRDVLLVVVDQPHAPIAEALALAKRVVGHVAVLEGRVDGHRPPACQRVQLLDKECMAVGHLGDWEDAEEERLGDVREADVHHAARTIGVRQLAGRRVRGKALDVLPGPAEVARELLPRVCHVSRRKQPSRSRVAR